MTDLDKHAKPLRVALVGAGYFSAFHADGWRRNPDAELAGIADLDVEQASRLARTEDGGPTPTAAFADADEMFRKIEADIIDIAAPPSAHLALIEQALQTDASTIICQKPFCGTLSDARRAIDMAAARGMLLVVHENFRFQPWYRVIRRLIDAGRVGDLYQVTFRLRPGDGQGEDAYLDRQPYFQSMERFLIHETAVHWIDTFRYLLGEPTSVYADLRRLNPVIAGEDSGYFIYSFTDGRRALFDGNRLVDHPADNTRLTMGELLVEGSTGVLALDGFGSVALRETGSDKWIALKEENYPRDRFGGDCVFALQKHVSDHMRHGSPIENDAASYIRNMEIEEAVYRSAREGRMIDLTGT
jgi:predicted dehydrogenase